MICFLFSGNIHFSLGISVSSKLFHEYNFYGDFDPLVILFAILLSIKSPVASAFFSVAFFEAVFITPVVDFSVLSRSFWDIFVI